jgi:hypothetical protein
LRRRTNHTISSTISASTTITMTMATAGELPEDDEACVVGAVDGVAECEGVVEASSGFEVAVGAGACNAFSGSTMP